MQCVSGGPAGPAAERGQQLLRGGCRAGPAGPAGPAGAGLGAGAGELPSQLRLPAPPRRLRPGPGRGRGHHRQLLLHSGHRHQAVPPHNTDTGAEEEVEIVSELV